MVLFNPKLACNGLHTFPMIISAIVNVLVRPKFELVNYDITVYRVSHYSTGILHYNNVSVSVCMIIFMWTFKVRAKFRKLTSYEIDSLTSNRVECVKFVNQNTSISPFLRLKKLFRTFIKLFISLQKWYIICHLLISWNGIWRQRSSWLDPGVKSVSKR